MFHGGRNVIRKKRGMVELERGEGKKYARMWRGVNRGVEKGDR